MRILVALTLLSGTVLFTNLLSPTRREVNSRQEAAFAAEVDPDLTTLGKYRAWTLVNPEPVQMDPQAAAMCARAQLGTQSVHSQKFISVFVNGEARESMLTKLNPSFPVGSMVVKEKLATKDSKSPELLTAMIKRDKGYYPEGGDWEYLLLDGTASKIIERGKLDKCNSCHTMYKAYDFVTRIYLPDDVRNALR